MDENTTNEVETVEEEVDDLGAAFDEEWGEDSTENDDFDLSDDSAEEPTDAQPEETEAAEETDEEPESSDDSAAEPEPESDGGGEDAGQDQSFTIKVNGEDRQVTLAEMTELAQKGSDYDRVKQERDTFKQDAPTIQKYKAYEAFLKELADSSGTDIESLIDGTRARLLMSKAEENGEDLTEEQAMAIAKAARQPKEEKAEPAAPPEESEEQKRNRAFAAFVSEYPNVDPKKIPQEVWTEFGRTFDLVGSYRKYEIKKLRSENEQLKLNQKNKERSTGSRRTAGATAPKDAFDEVWDED